MGDRGRKDDPFDYWEQRFKASAGGKELKTVEELKGLESLKSYTVDLSWPYPGSLGVTSVNILP